MKANTDPSCYHCGLPLPADAPWQVVVDGVARSMCCAGCEAVASAIVANGLTDYYRHRDQLPESPREALPTALQDLGLFDLPEIQKDFVRTVQAGDSWESADAELEEQGQQDGQGRQRPRLREANLMLEGITCAACIWLNEAHLARQPGVVAVDINYATRRARVRWDDERIHLSQILAAIAAIGYRAHPYDPQLSENLAQKERRSALWRLFVAGFGMMQVMMYAIPVYIAKAGEMTTDIEQLMRWASFMLTLPVMFYSAAPFFRNAWQDLRLQRLGMDVPVALGMGCAFLASTWATLTHQGEVYFDSVTMFVFFLLTGRYFEMMARQHASRGVEALAHALPAFATRLPDYPAPRQERLAAVQLQRGDVVLVRPGETIPADGSILEGQSNVDESLLSGESLPRSRGPSEALVGGSVNITSPLIMRVEHLGEETRLASIRRLVERAALEKPRLVEMANRIAARFVAALIALALVTAIVWYFIDPTRLLWVFVAVLVVSCPCALSLATPVALTVATTAFTRLGALVTRAHAIETLARVDEVIFDKTGTLTEGRLQLVRMLPAGAEPDRHTEAELLAWAACLEQGSEHPIARALSSAAQAAGLDISLALTDVRAVTGQGMEAGLNGRRLRIGRLEHVAALHGKPLPAAWQDAMATTATATATATAMLSTAVFMADEQDWLGLFILQDRLRSDAKSLIDELRRAGIGVSILSGDTQAAVDQVARQLGVTDAQGGLTPEGKHACLQQRQAQGRVVAMVGDGVNDAPVLARAQVSVAMGSGADLARQAADVVLLGGNLQALAAAIRQARQTLRIIRQNLLWAFSYNFLAIPAAMLGWITPWMAGIGMSVSSLLVVLNALRLQRGKPTAGGMN